MASKKSASAPVIDDNDTLAFIQSLPKDQQDLFEALRVKLTTAKTLAELVARVDPDFKTGVSTLPEPAQRALRDTFSVIRDDVKHKVKMDAIANKVVIISDPPDFPPASAEYPNSVFCVIKGKIEESDETFECVSGAIRVVRHFQESRTESYPQRIEFYRESAAAMAARNAQPLPNGDMPSPMWLVRKTAPARAANRDGIPF